MKENTTYRIKRLTATQTATQSNTTLQTITELVASIKAKEIHKFKFSLFVKGKADSDVKFGVIGPANAVVTIGLQSVEPKVTAGATGLAVSLTDDVLSLVILEGVIDNTLGADGSISPQFSQNVSQGDDLVAQIGSCFEVWQISDTT